jgi:hypothetical protein
MNLSEKINESIAPELLKILFERGEIANQYTPIALHPSSTLLFLAECKIVELHDRQQLREYPGILRIFGWSEWLSKDDVQEILYELSHRQEVRSIYTILSRVILLFWISITKEIQDYQDILIQTHKSGDLLEILWFLGTKKWTKIELYQFFSMLLSQKYRQNSRLSPRMLEILSRGTEELLLAKTSHKWLVDAFLLAAIQEWKSGEVR